MLIGFVLTLARRKVQANADAGGEMGKEEEVGSCRRNMARTSAPFVPWDLGRRITALENV